MVSMKSNAPSNYVCPICLGNQGVENDNTLLKQDDLVFRDALVSVWINSFWVGINKGHVIVVPNDHFETLYELPMEIGHHIFEISQKVSLAMKEEYRCDGVTIRQNNEPAGDQHAFHYHLHIFPRYLNDNFNQEMANSSVLSDPEERKEYCHKLKQHISQV
jgi:histidine triad (HIT) family protein